MPMIIGIKSSSHKGRFLAEDSATRRIMTPQLPPVRYWIINQPMQPMESPTQKMNVQR